MERQQFGNRCPEGYFKEGLLGKGGYAVVWRLKNLDTGEMVAAKQFPRRKGKYDSSSDVEIKVHENLSEFYLTHTDHPGFQSITKLISKIDDSKDRWLVYEIGGKCLT